MSMYYNPGSVSKNELKLALVLGSHQLSRTEIRISEEPRLSCYS